jgi:hypothetical protein
MYGGMGSVGQRQGRIYFILLIVHGSCTGSKYYTTDGRIFLRFYIITVCEDVALEVPSFAMFLWVRGPGFLFMRSLKLQHFLYFL